MQLLMNPLCISTNFKSNNIRTQNSGQKNSDTEKAVKVAGAVSLLGLVGLSAYGIAILNKKPPRSTFEALLKERDLVFKDNILFDKHGNKFSGSLTRSTGKKGENGFEMIETKLFNNGILEEQIYKDCFNNELKGMFYKDGKIVSKVDVFSNGKDKGFSFIKYRDDGTGSSMGHGLVKKSKSVFDIFRNNKVFEQWINRTHKDNYYENILYRYPKHHF